MQEIFKLLRASNLTIHMAKLSSSPLIVLKQFCRRTRRPLNYWTCTQATNSGVTSYLFIVNGSHPTLMKTLSDNYFATASPVSLLGPFKGSLLLGENSSMVLSKHSFHTTLVKLWLLTRHNWWKHQPSEWIQLFFSAGLVHSLLTKLLVQKQTL